MNPSAPEKPVFIDQMPDYQQALRQIAALPPEKIPGVVAELRLTDEFQKRNAALDSLEARGQALWAKVGKIDSGVKAFYAKAGTVVHSGAAVGVAAGVGAGIVAGKRWGRLKGTLAGIGAALVAFGGWVVGGIHMKYKSMQQSANAAMQDYQALTAQVQQLDGQVLATKDQFAAEMATRMLEEQKMLVGQGADMKLVSTKEPSQALSDPRAATMAGKYAQPPAASKAEAVQQFASFAVPQR